MRTPILSALLLATALGSAPSIALAAPPAAAEHVGSVASSTVTVDTVRSDADRYAAREAKDQAKPAAKFRGGSEVVLIGGGTLTVVLLVLILVILL